MNKLAIYRNNYWNEYLEKEESFGVEHDEAFNLGFDAVIALNLAVKFTKWFDSPQQSFKEWQRSNYFFGRDNKIEEAYKYWVENIFKIE